MKLLASALTLSSTMILFGPCSAIKGSISENSKHRTAFQEVLGDLKRDYEKSVNGQRRLKGGNKKKPDKDDAGGEDPGLYTPIRIVVDEAPLLGRVQSEVESQDYDTAIAALSADVLPQVVQAFESMLSVQAPEEPVNLRNRRANCGHVPLPVDPMEDGDFFVIFDGVRDSEEPLCQAHHNLAAITTPCAFDLFPLNPRAGIISICLDRINLEGGVVSESEIDRLVSLQMGEMAVALGATSDLFGFYNDETGEPSGYSMVAGTGVNCLDGTPATHIPAIVQQSSYQGGSVSFFEVVTPRVTQVVRNIFDCQSMSGARLENQPFKPSSGDGECIGDGWDLRLLHEEVLASHVDASLAHKVLSPVTLALLEDSGWYQVDFTKAGALSFGLGAGCDFVEGSCIDPSTNEIAASSQGMFCEEEFLKVCDPTYHASAFCVAAGGIAQYDNCPVAIEAMDFCPAGERCFQMDNEDARCLAAECVDGQVEITYEGSVYTCTSDFEVIEVEGLLFDVHCPRIASFCPALGCPAACSGRGICEWDEDGSKCDCFDGFGKDMCETNGGGGKKKNKKDKKNGRRVA